MDICAAKEMASEDLNEVLANPNRRWNEKIGK
jgi:hypothetical protein